jgi:succinate dehydrogenase / fumarate reductase membrane anchor subunit
MGHFCNFRSFNYHIRSHSMGAIGTKHGSGKGINDWMIQRASAVIMFSYLLLLCVALFTISPGFQGWHAFFAMWWVKIATLIFLVSLLFHAWIGIWTVLTDYVHQGCIRLILEFIFVLSLFAYFFWGLLIIWSV